MTTQEIQTLTGLSPEEIEKRILAASTACKERKNGSICFCRSVFVETKGYENVLVSIPIEPKPVKSHLLGVFDSRDLKKLSKLEILEVPDHFTTGDFLRYENGEAKPIVIRHFLMPKESTGKKIVAKVTVQRKVDLITGGEMIMLNITHTPGAEPKRKMILGTRPLGRADETMIPETGKCIRFEELAPRKDASTEN